MLDWIPVDRLAESLTELLESGKDAPSIRVLHAVNSRRVEWGEVAGKAAENLFGKNSSEFLVDLEEWIVRLEKSDQESSDDFDSNPALKLLYWYKDIAAGRKQAVYQTKAMEARSMTFRNMEAVNDGWLDRWFDQWAF